MSKILVGPDLRPWLATITEDSIRTVATKLDQTAPNLNQQLKGETPIPAATVIRICRLYDVNPIHGLAVAKFVSDGEVLALSKKVDPGTICRQLTNRQLLDELNRRLDELERELKMEIAAAHQSRNR